jgi:hypothetical protein
MEEGEKEGERERQMKGERTFSVHKDGERKSVDRVRS